MNTRYQQVRLKLLPYLSKALLKVSPRPDLRRLGNDRADWVVPTSLLTESSVCYCVGVGEDISFDLALIELFGCHVFAFDPTPRAAAHVKQHAADINRFHFLEVGLWSCDQTMKFFAPTNAQHVSHSIVNLQKTSSFFEAECRRLSSLMQQLGHTSLDLLKLDVEGAEYEVLNSIIEDKIVPRILCVEFDQPVPYRKTWRMIKRILGLGYRLVSIDAWNYTFLRIEAVVPAR